MLKNQKKLKNIEIKQEKIKNNFLFSFLASMKILFLVIYI
jgi:hypothetical protein